MVVDWADRLRARSLSDMTEATVTLFRPVGVKELELIRDSGMKAFPPRLPTQPIFYPVLNEDYATQIARDWNAKDANSGYAGFVLRFQVLATYIAQFDVHRVGGRVHDEYWIPAERLAEFNDSIVGEIEIIAEFRGNNS
jgi:hypothetical protein